nr:thermonuclease family protein [Propionivibrio soli]
MVVAITDGDTVKTRCATAGRYEQITIRLAEIDAPEKRQPFGEKSRQSLAELCFGVEAEIRAQTTDRYGRTVARIVCRGRDANAEQVRRGMAWVYDRYVTDRGLYGLQEAAQRSRVGLWREADPMPPWEWRRERRKPT